MKESLNDTFFVQKEVLGEKNNHLSEIWLNAITQILMFSLKNVDPLRARQE